MPITECDTPSQVFEMTTESQNSETTAVHADWVVGDTRFELRIPFRCVREPPPVFRRF